MNKKRVGVPKQKWTVEEEDALRLGVEKHGVGKWRNIQKDEVVGPVLASRTNVDLKDKWRNLTMDSASSRGTKRKQQGLGRPPRGYSPPPERRESGRRKRRRPRDASLSPPGRPRRGMPLHSPGSGLRVLQEAAAGLEGDEDGPLGDGAGGAAGGPDPSPSPARQPRARRSTANYGKSGFINDDADPDRESPEEDEGESPLRDGEGDGEEEEEEDDLELEEEEEEEDLELDGSSSPALEGSRRPRGGGRRTDPPERRWGVPQGAAATAAATAGGGGRPRRGTYGGFPNPRGAPEEGGSTRRSVTGNGPALAALPPKRGPTPEDMVVAALICLNDPVGSSAREVVDWIEGHYAVDAGLRATLHAAVEHMVAAGRLDEAPLNPNLLRLSGVVGAAAQSAGLPWPRLGPPPPHAAAADTRTALQIAEAAARAVAEAEDAAAHAQRLADAERLRKGGGEHPPGDPPEANPPGGSGAHAHAAGAGERAARGSAGVKAEEEDGGPGAMAGGSQGRREDGSSEQLGAAGQPRPHSGKALVRVEPARPLQHAERAVPSLHRPGSPTGHLLPGALQGPPLLSGVIGSGAVLLGEAAAGPSRPPSRPPSRGMAWQPHAPAFAAGSAAGDLIPRPSSALADPPAFLAPVAPLGGPGSGAFAAAEARALGPAAGGPQLVGQLDEPPAAAAAAAASAPAAAASAVAAAAALRSRHFGEPLPPFLAPPLFGPPATPHIVPLLSIGAQVKRDAPG